MSLKINQVTGDVLNKIYIKSGLTGDAFAKLLDIGRTKLYGLFSKSEIDKDIIELINRNEQLNKLFEQIKKEQKNDTKHETFNPNALQDARLLCTIDELKHENETFKVEIAMLKKWNAKLFESNAKLIDLISKINK